jgi:predicted cupin superfamily sugar epimerase
LERFFILKALAMNNRVKQLIESLDLQPHPEGGYFKEVYRSSQTLESPQNGQYRSAVTDIYFLLTETQISRLHKVAHDEIWHFYEGAPLRLLDIASDGQQATEVFLGQQEIPVNYKHTVGANRWQGAQSTGDYSLVGCTVAPGFDFADFSFLADDKSLCVEFSARHPHLTAFI